MSPPQQARIAVTAIFALNGALFASIFSRLPAIQERVDIGDGALGLALLCAMLGLLASQLVAGPLIARRGSRTLVIVGGLGYALALVPVALADSFALLAVSLAFAGLCNGVLDVSMNTHGLTVEKQLGHPILSTLHAAFSFGALGGAALGGLVASAGVGVEPHLFTVSAAGVVSILVAGHYLLAPTQLRRGRCSPFRAGPCCWSVRSHSACCSARAPSTTGPPSTWRASSVRARAPPPPAWPRSR